MDSEDASTERKFRMTETIVELEDRLVEDVGEKNPQRQDCRCQVCEEHLDLRRKEIKIWK